MSDKVPVTNLEIKYRTWFKGFPPRRIKLEIPGWAGHSLEHSDGAKPQPWHCQPFVEGSTYGLELIYPFESECHVYLDDNKEVIFEGNFEKDRWNNATEPQPPFSAFAPGHYGFTSSLDLIPPENYVTRIEPHPRFFVDSTGTVPIVVPGHIQRWWPRIFFVVFKSPRENETHIFRKGEPYGQVLFVPQKINYHVKPMTPGEIVERHNFENNMLKFQNQIIKNGWNDYKGNRFDDKYKQLATIYSKFGQEGLDKKIEQVKIRKNNKKLKNRFIRRK